MNFANALGLGYTAKEAIDFILRRFPELQSKLNAAQNAGYSSEQMIKYLSKLKPKEMEQLEKTRGIGRDSNPLIAGQQAQERGGPLGENLSNLANKAVPLTLGAGGAVLASQALKGLPQLANNPLAQGLMNKLGISAPTSPDQPPQITENNPPAIGNIPIQGNPSPNDPQSNAPNASNIQSQQQQEDPIKHAKIIEQIPIVKNLLDSKSPLPPESLKNIADFLMSPEQKQWLEQQTDAPLAKIIEDYQIVSESNPRTNENEKSATEKNEITNLNYRGNPVDFDKIPEKIYHVTTDKKAVEESGILKPFGDKGKGLGGVHKNVSFTDNKEIAETLQNDMKFSSKYFNKFPFSSDDLLKNEEISNKYAQSGVALKAYKFLQDEAKKEGWHYQHFDDYIGTPGWSSEELRNSSPLEILRDFFDIRKKETGKINPLFTKEIFSDPENMGIIEVNKHMIKDKNKIRSGDEFLNEVSVYDEVPIKNKHENSSISDIFKKQKGSITSFQGMPATIESIKNGIAKVNINGKERHVKESELEEASPDVQEAVRNILNIPERDSSAVTAYFGYDPNSKSLAVQYHNGNLYTYDNVDQSKIDLLANKLGIPVTSGKNIFGEWEEGKQDSLGAALIKEIVKSPEYSKDNKDKTWRKYDTGYDYWEKLRQKPKRLGKKSDDDSEGSKKRKKKNPNK